MMVLKKQTIHSWGFPNAKFITDYWHLFEKGLKDKFGLIYFKLIYDELKGMANAFNENTFNEYYHQAMTILNNHMPRNVSIENKLIEFANEIETYALYKVNLIIGPMKKGVPHLLNKIISMY
jgi:hypothetical protein